MKKLLSLISVMTIVTEMTFTQSLNTWVSGSNMRNQSGVYGTKGIGSNSNIPGARQNSHSWSENDTLWLFGGYGLDNGNINGYLNDLWKFDINNLQWTWVSGDQGKNQSGTYGSKGVGSTSNIPGSRNRSITWTEDDTLWLFGGGGYDGSGNGGYLNDLWKFDKTTREWTWVSGSNTVNPLGTYGSLGVGSNMNTPGGRSGSISWSENDTLWLFGGYGYDEFGSFGHLNDLWKFDKTTRQWTWVNGSNGVNQKGTYGTKGAGSSSNIPGARERAKSWTQNNNLWLFGGYGYDSAGTIAGQLNDLWKFNKSTREWIWVSGSDSSNRKGMYGIIGMSSASNLPGARESTVTWTKNDTLWLMGGIGFDATGTYGALNDLWRYSLSNNQWTWVNGDSLGLKNGIYGTLGVGSLSNFPGSRQSAISWMEQDNFWLWGGIGVDANGNVGNMNDLWSININCIPANITSSTADVTLCKSGSALFTVSAEHWVSGYQWQRDTGTGWHNLGGETNDTLTLSALDSNSSGFLYRCIVTGYCGNDTGNAATLTVNDPITGWVKHDTICQGQDATLQASGNSGSTIAWYEGNSGGEILKLGSTLNVATPSAADTFYTDAATMGASDTLNAWQTPDGRSYGMVFSLVSMAEILSLNSMDLGLRDSGTVDLSVYYRIGPFSGFEGSTGAWTLLDTFLSKPCQADTVSNTSFVFDHPLVLKSTQTYSFMVLATNGNALSYKTAGTTNNVLYNNADVHFYTGMALSNPLGSLTQNHKSIAAVFNYSASQCVHGTRTPVYLTVNDNPDITGISSSLNPNYHSIYTPLQCTNLTATTSGGSGSYAYTWTPSGTGNPLNACPTSGTWYTATVTDANGCQDTMSFKQYVIDASSSYAGRVTMCIKNTRTNRNSTLPVTLSLVPYYLGLPGNSLGACGAVPSKQGDNGYDDFADWYRIFPNPFANELNIEFMQMFEEDVRLSLTDLTGRVLKEIYHGKLYEGELVQFSLDASDLNRGMYLIRYESNTDMRVNKVQLVR